MHTITRARPSAVAAAVVAALLAGCGGASQDEPTPRAQAQAAAIEEDILEVGGAPVDYGPGPGLPRDSVARRMAQGATTSAVGVPTGTPEAAQKGLFGEAFHWPIIPIHVALTPDGRVLSYGTTVAGVQSGLLNYVVWDPAQGQGPEAFLDLPNGTATDIFCAGQALIPSTGEILLAGGDATVDAKRNYGTADANLFNPADNSLTRVQSMAFRRWYPTLVTTETGDQVALGGRMDKPLGDAETGTTGATYATQPEVFNRATGTWRTLSTAAHEKAYGSHSMAWWYPHAWLAPHGQIAVIAHGGNTFNLNVAGTGTITMNIPKAAVADYRLPSVMYSPGRVLSIRNGMVAQTIDIRTTKPVIKATGPISRHRLYGNTTVLPNGRVWANGGSPIGNELGGEHYVSETWDPATGVWTEGAAATKARLYHSMAMLLPDGSVLTGGGGAPGPILQLNAEIYYPPYLFQADGTPAVRPVINSAPSTLTLGQKFKVTMGATGRVSRVTLLRVGANTHAFNNEQRYRTLFYTQSGSTLNVTLPNLRNEIPPGWYYLFALDASGVPSVAKTVFVG